MDDYGMPDEWLDRDLVLDLGAAPARGDLHAGPHPGPLRLRRRGAWRCSSPATTCCPTITPSIGFEPRVRRAAVARLPRLAGQGARASRHEAAARPRTGDRRPRTPASTSWSPPRRPPRAVPCCGRRRARHGVGGRRRAALDPPRAPPRRARPVRRRAGRLRDAGPPRRCSPCAATWCAPTTGTSGATPCRRRSRVGLTIDPHTTGERPGTSGALRVRRAADP